MPTTVRFYDATLTAGLWQQGHRLSPARRAALARELDAGRVDYMEIALLDAATGQTVWMVDGFRPRHAKPTMRVPLGSEAASNAQRTAHALRTTLPVLAFHLPTTAPPAAWQTAIQQARAAQREVLVVFVDFFHAHRQAPNTAWTHARVALESGASAITLGDARGEALPWEMSDLVYMAVRRFPDAVVGVHSNNANACADDNALVAVRQGARLVHGTLHGHGHGRGFADLTHIRAVLFREAGPAHDDAAILRHLWETGQTLDQWLYAPAEQH